MLHADKADDFKCINQTLKNKIEREIDELSNQVEEKFQKHSSKFNIANATLETKIEQLEKSLREQIQKLEIDGDTTSYRIDSIETKYNALKQEDENMQSKISELQSINQIARHKFLVIIVTGQIEFLIERP